MSTYTPTEDRSDGQFETEHDAWAPEPCELRESADRDVSGHAARNIALLGEGARQGEIPPAAARESIRRIRDGIKNPASDGEGDGGS